MTIAAARDAALLSPADRPVGPVYAPRRRVSVVGMGVRAVMAWEATARREV
jgi:hypothetical protein